MAKKKSKLLDFNIMDDVLDLQFEIFGIFNNVPKKYKNNIMQEIHENIHYAKLFLAKCLNMPQYSKTHVTYKRDMLVESFAHIKLIESDFYQLNRLGAVSNETITGLTLKFYDLKKNYDSFTSYFNRRLKKMKDVDEFEQVEEFENFEQNLEF